MDTNTTCNWIGTSGTTYTYHVYTLPQTFSKKQDGNYIYVTIVNNQWNPIYIGEGDLGERVSENHHQAECISKKGATHVHAHLNSSEKSRTSEESDLLANYTQSYSPTGCNEKTGG